MGSFMIKTSVTVPNMPKYSFSFSELVCQLRPPTNSFPGAGSDPLLLVAVGVDRPDEPDCEVVVTPFGHCWAGGDDTNWVCVEMGGEPFIAANPGAAPFIGFIAISAFCRSCSIRALAVSMLVALQCKRKNRKLIHHLLNYRSCP